MKDVISTTKAREIDARWVEAGMQPDSLHLVLYAVAGNRTMGYLTIPGNDAAPCYEFLTHNPETGDHSPAYYHVSGPTLDDWQAQREATEASREARELYEWASGR